MTPDAAAVSSRLRRLYGEDPATARGVLHVVSAWPARDGALRVIRIGAGSPTSETDGFVLRAMRMRADAIVTTGKILRDEPAVEHAESDPTLLAWRRQCVGKHEPPRSVVLTSGRELDLAHPLLRSAHAPLVVTSVAAQPQLRARARAAERSVEVIGRAAPGLRDTIAVLQELGCKTISIEAGPTTAGALYQSPPLVDELLLSICEADDVDVALAGPALPSSERLQAVFRHASQAVRTEEPSGVWAFSRMRR